MKRLGIAGVVCLGLAHSTPAFAGVSSRLIYSRGADASSCPDETALRKAVADRLGYDPFVAYARTTVVAQVLREKGRLQAHAHWVDDEGIQRGSRDLVADSDDCSKLVAALALAISIALDPMAGSSVSSDAEPPEPPPEEPPSPVDPIPPAEPEAPPPPSSPPRDAASPKGGTRHPDRAWAQAGARIFGTTGSLPALSGGVAGFFRLHVSRHASMDLEGQVQLPASLEAPPAGPGRASAWAWTGALVPCWHAGPAAVCGLATLGQIVTHGERVATPRSETALTAAMGLRGILAFALSGTVSVEAHGDISAALLRNDLSLNGLSVWRTPPVAGAIGVGMAARIF